VSYRILFLYVALWCLGPASRVCSAAVEEDLYRVLGEQNIPFDTNAVQGAALAGMLEQVDPRAVIVAATDTNGYLAGRTVESVEQFGGGLCYVTLNGMYPGGGTNVIDLLGKHSRDKCSGLILDARGSGGSDLESVDQISSLFVSGGDVLYAVNDGRGETVSTHRAPERACAGRLAPVMLLVDRETRDASEVLAMVLKDRPGIMLIGSATRGDPAVRELVPLSREQVLYVATGWIAPVEGEGYLDKGIMPNILVSGEPEQPPIRPEDRVGLRPLSEKAIEDIKLAKRIADDPGLRRAVDILLGLEALGLEMGDVVPDPKPEDK